MLYWSKFLKFISPEILIRFEKNVRSFAFFLVFVFVLSRAFRRCFVWFHSLLLKMLAAVCSFLLSWGVVWFGGLCVCCHGWLWLSIVYRCGVFRWYLLVFFFVVTILFCVGRVKCLLFLRGDCSQVAASSGISSCLVSLRSLPLRSGMSYLRGRAWGRSRGSTCVCCG